MFVVGDWELLYDSKYQYNLGMVQTHQLEPYEIIVVFPNGAVQLSTIAPVHFKLLVNGHHLKLYHKPVSREKFL